MFECVISCTSLIESDDQQVPEKLTGFEDQTGNGGQTANLDSAQDQDGGWIDDANWPMTEEEDLPPGVGWAPFDPDAGSTVIAGAGGTGEFPPESDLPLFSFFVTSLEAMQRLSGSQNGFGGDLRYGEKDGLAGADKICTEIAEYSMLGASRKQWRAFLSTATGGPDGGPVHAIDRIGEGPWYDRAGRMVALDKASLLYDRPLGADPFIINDLPNEYGIPNQYPDGTPESYQDNHHVMTGSGVDGKLFPDTTGMNPTCQDWTNAEATGGKPMCGMSFPRNFGGIIMPGGPTSMHWISAYQESGCLPGVNILQDGMGNPLSGIVGSGGGYGGIYCFALNP